MPYQVEDSPFPGSGGKKGIRRKLVLLGLEEPVGCHTSANAIKKDSIINRTQA